MGVANCALEFSGEGESEETTAGSSGITASVVGRFVSYTIRSGHFMDDAIRMIGLDADLLRPSRLAGRYASATNNIERRKPPTNVKYRKRGICTD
jgi:hypothetical protein